MNRYRNLLAQMMLLVLIVALLAGCATTPTAEPTTAAVGTEEPTAVLEATEVVAEPTAAEEPTAAAAEATQAPVAEEPTSEPMAEHEGRLILATTTSTEDSGLLDYLLPLFEAESGMTVDVIAVGTGQAIALGEDGNADVLLVHARAKEDAFMEAGSGVRREDVMYNDFVIVGPEDDPAGIQGLPVEEAMAKLAETESSFISRGDESGTHTKELSVWKAASIEPSGDWYVSAGQGMGDVLRMADEMQGYTLSDRATYLAQTKEGLSLVVLVEGDKTLLNPYGVIAVNPEKNAFIRGDAANTFIDWIISLPVQEKIAQFGMEDFGQSLFVPDSQAWRDANAK
ncbi:MAG: ABC transporter substrate-binding protein [Anaerolineae bacterium]